MNDPPALLPDWRRPSTWVVWDGLLAPLTDIATRAGVNPFELRAWLNDVGGSGRLRGLPCRVASPEEAAEAIAAETEFWSSHTLVRFIDPDGSASPPMSVTKAAKRLLLNDGPCGPAALRQALLRGRGRVSLNDGHSVVYVRKTAMEDQPQQTQHQTPQDADEQQAPAPRRRGRQPGSGTRKTATRKPKGLQLTDEAIAMLTDAAIHAGVDPSTLVVAGLPCSSPLQQLVDAAVEVLPLLSARDVQQFVAIAAVARAESSKANEANGSYARAGETS